MWDPRLKVRGRTRTSTLVFLASPSSSSRRASGSLTTVSLWKTAGGSATEFLIQNFWGGALAQASPASRTVEEGCSCSCCSRRSDTALCCSSLFPRHSAFLPNSIRPHEWWRSQGREVEMAFLSEGHHFRTVIDGLSKQLLRGKRWKVVRKATERGKMVRVVLKCGSIYSPGGGWTGKWRLGHCSWSTCRQNNSIGARKEGCWCFRRGGRQTKDCQLQCLTALCLQL